MPKLPVAGKSIAAFPYDPIRTPVPIYTGAANQYWIDAGHPACSDSGRGSKLAPRCSLPGIYGATWSLAAGSQVFIVGGGNTYGNGATINSMRLPGTPSNPIWLIGVSAANSTNGGASSNLRPRFYFARFSVGQTGTLTHVLIDGLHFYNPTDRFRFIVDKSDPDSTGTAGYLTIRNSACSGSGTLNPGGVESNVSSRCFSFVGRLGNEVKFVVMYRNEIHGLGRWVPDYLTSVDLHGIQAQGAVRYLWILGSRIYHLQGDGFQCSNSKLWDMDPANRPHYVYVAGNEFFANYENGYDSKGCYHVVVSQNRFFDFNNPLKDVNSTAIIAAQDAESFAGDRYAWFLNNQLQNVGDAVSYKGTADDAFVYFLGNLAVNLNLGAAVPIDARCHTESGVPYTTCGDGMYFAMNTIDCGQQVSGFAAPRSGTTSDPAVSPEAHAQSISVVGNIFLECLDDAGTPHRFRSNNANWRVEYNYNVDFRESGGPIQLQDPPLIDRLTGNRTSVDPLIANATNRLSGNYRLRSGSPAMKMVPEPPVYALFEQLYGISIRKDLAGRAWAPGSMLNAGAYQ